MDIISIEFVTIAIISVFVFYLIYPKYRNIFLTILSCGFIASLNYFLLPYIILYTLINYYIGLKLPGASNKKILYITGLIINLAQLIILKYAPFIIDPVFMLFNSNIRISHLSEIIVPVGISYFSLQSIGYLINVKMGWEKPESNFIDFLTYIIFFPKFISGPIERSNHFLTQIKKSQSFNDKQIKTGLKIILIGIFKKLAIANQLAPYVISANNSINSLDGSSLWIIFLVQPLYLYFDFSGYTDIAIGFSKMIGLDLLPNFNRPFFSQNMTSFWKRFHISLSSWFHDYIFRQVSFKYRKWGISASVFALFITWILFGIWHGAGWNFMILGLLQAIAIIYEFFTKKWRVSIFSKIPLKINLWFSRVCTYLFYCISLVFFFAPNINSVIIFLKKLTQSQLIFKLDGITAKPFFLLLYIPIFLFLEFLQEDHNKIFTRFDSFWNRNAKFNRYLRWSLYSIIITILFISGFKEQQFIYADF